MRFDIHIHTEISECSRLAVAEIIDKARSMGLDGVCITDHYSMAAADQVEEGLQLDGLCVIIGMEYATDDGDFLLFGCPSRKFYLAVKAHAVGGVWGSEMSLLS